MGMNSTRSLFDTIGQLPKKYIQNVMCMLFLTVLLVSTTSHGAIIEISAKKRFFKAFNWQSIIFRESCMEEWNADKNVTEYCCAGNYKCSSDICKQNRLCGVMRIWCYNKSCKQKVKEVEVGKEKEHPVSSDEAKHAGQEAEATDEGGFGDDSEKNNAVPSPSQTASPSSPSAPQPSPTLSPSPTPSVTSSQTPSNTPPPSEPLSQTPTPALLRCDTPRTRHEIRDLPPSELSNFLQMLRRLQTDRDENGVSEWDKLVRTHMQHSDEAHGGSCFLPWHRLFLLKLENLLRRYDSSVSVPYWDWTIDAADAAMSTIWNEGYLGGAQKSNQPIVDGVFHNLAAVYPDEHVVRRNFNSGHSGDIPRLWGMGSLEGVMSESSYMNFSDGMEAAHSLPHVYIGGDMSDAWRAPNDPIFYLHHAFVDSLWWMRQQSKDREEFGGTHDFMEGTEHVSKERLLGAFEVKIEQALEMDCVTYAQPRSGRGVERDVVANEKKDVCDMVSGGHAIGKGRCERGRDVLRRNASGRE